MSVCPLMIGVQFASIEVLVCLGLCTSSRGSTVSLFVSAFQEGELFLCLSLQQLNCFALRLLVNSLTQAVAPKKGQCDEHNAAIGNYIFVLFDRP